VQSSVLTPNGPHTVDKSIFFTYLSLRVCCDTTATGDIGNGGLIMLTRQLPFFPSASALPLTLRHGWEPHGH
jgi:hypothetical protein